uniref:Uracil-DNA glycosylase n=1 Tax=Lingulaulax polyedra TaxID=160621 RepID=A0A516AGB0_LINPO|nr:uracil-DNA glycosylase [Lingulodinium polyedra]
MAPKKRKAEAGPKQKTLPFGGEKGPQEPPQKRQALSNEDALAAITGALHEEGWRGALEGEFAKPYFAEIARFVADERAAHAVYPPADKVFEAFNLTPLKDLKVVLIGQDPYHEPGQAHGLCFSVPPGTNPPPSLKNMYKELEADIAGFKTPTHGHLVQWAKQGVLMLNATLTVRGGHTEANSHSKCGWQKFTDEVIRVVNAHAEGVVFLLWGGFAQKKGKIIDKSRHTVIESAHPSPLSARKWHGCKTFSKCNAALKALGRTEVKWLLD